MVLQRVLSASLDPKKSWFALNSALCSGKPSRLCSLGYARVFLDEYRQVEFDDLVREFPRPRVGFRPTADEQKKVYVASAFVMLLGILRQRSLEELPFIHSEDFQRIVSWINAFTCNMFSCSPLTPPSTLSPPKPKSAPFPENPQDLSPK